VARSQNLVAATLLHAPQNLYFANISINTFNTNWIMIPGPLSHYDCENLVHQVMSTCLCSAD